MKKTQVVLNNILPDLHNLTIDEAILFLQALQNKFISRGCEGVKLYVSSVSTRYDIREYLEVQVLTAVEIDDSEKDWLRKLEKGQL